MAVIQYTGIVNQIRGKLNGSVFNKSKNAYTLQRKQQVSRGVTSRQAQNRQVFSNAQREWKSLNATQKATWSVVAQNNPSRDRFGDQTVLSGYNQYIKAFRLCRLCGLDVPGSPSPLPAPQSPLSSFVLSNTVFFEDTPGVLEWFTVFEPTYSGDRLSFGYIFDISLPISEGVSSYHGRFHYVTGGRLPEEEEYDVVGVLGSRYPKPKAGDRYIVRLRILHFNTGVIVEDVRQDVSASFL